MTVRQVYESTLIELKKLHTGALKLFEFNYYLPKAINQYVNKVYNIYDTSQQTSDDLRVLTASADINKDKIENNFVEFPTDYLHLLSCRCTFTVNNSRCNKVKEIKSKATRYTADASGMIEDNYYNRPSIKKPYYFIHNEVNKNNIIPTDLSDDQRIGTDGKESEYIHDISEDYYKIAEVFKQKISEKIESIQKQGNLAISGENYYYQNLRSFNLYICAYLNLEGKVMIIYRTENRNLDIPLYNVSRDYEVELNNQGFYQQIKAYTNPNDVTSETFNTYFRKISPNKNRSILKLSDVLKTNTDKTLSLANKTPGYRYGNTQPVRCEIKFGDKKEGETLSNVHIEYIKTPIHVELTQDQLDSSEDYSQMMEFPDYVNQEIINELVHLVMENQSNPRLTTNIQMTNTIARPTGQQQAAAPA